MNTPRQCRIDELEDRLREVENRLEALAPDESLAYIAAREAPRDRERTERVGMPGGDTR